MSDLENDSQQSETFVCVRLGMDRIRKSCQKIATCVL